MSLHTPGPWSAEPFAGTWNVWSKQTTNGGDAVVYDCAEADAHLIAAAPAMLAALELYVKRERELHGPMPIGMRSVTGVIEAAIRAAKGEV